MALRITFLLGIQAILGHEPPIRARSITAGPGQLPCDVLAGFAAQDEDLVAPDAGRVM